MTRKLSIIELDEYGQATLLRGFASQIDKLKLPRLTIVKKLAEGIGLAILTADEAKEINTASKEVDVDVSATFAEYNKIIDIYKDREQAVKLALGNGNWSDQEKLHKIRDIII